MTILTWIILGLVAGWIATLLMGSGGYGLIGDLAVGILGAVVGGWLGSAGARPDTPAGTSMEPDGLARNQMPLVPCTRVAPSSSTWSARRSISALEKRCLEPRARRIRS